MKIATKIPIKTNCTKKAEHFLLFRIFLLIVIKLLCQVSIIFRIFFSFDAISESFRTTYSMFL